MKQYNLAFSDKAETKPSTYIIEHSEFEFEGFYLCHSIGMFKDPTVAAKTLWYLAELSSWEPSAAQRKLPT